MAFLLGIIDSCDLTGGSGWYETLRKRASPRRNRLSHSIDASIPPNVMDRRHVQGLAGVPSSMALQIWNCDPVIRGAGLLADGCGSSGACANSPWKISA
jgi:hypothetical protein